MIRSNFIIYISHCILNQNSVVKPLARSSGAYASIIDEIMINGIGIEQLPCPEMLYLGMDRKPMTKEEYDTLDYNALCKELADRCKLEIDEYISKGYNIVGIIGIKESPTCSIEGQKGIFMKYLMKNVDIFRHNYLEVPVDYLENDEKTKKEFLKKLKKFLNND